MIPSNPKNTKNKLENAFAGSLIGPIGIPTTPSQNPLV